MKEQIKQFLEGLISRIGCKVTDVEIEERDDEIYVNVLAEDESKILIGRDSRNLKSIQQLLKVYILTLGHNDLAVFLDINSYRSNQEQSVKDMAMRAAQKVRETGGDEALPPMSSYFRRIVHLYLATEEFSDLSTESEGDYHSRHVVIKRVHEVF